jgi:hypothetical protein
MGRGLRYGVGMGGRDGDGRAVGHVDDSHGIGRRLVGHEDFWIGGGTGGRVVWL